MFECILCNYSHENRKNFLQHCNTKNHIIKEETNNRCCICNKSYKSSITYKKHKKNIHGNTIINIKNIIEDKNIEENNKININKTTKLKKIRKSKISNINIMNEIEIVKEKIDKNLNNLNIVKNNIDISNDSIKTELQIIKENVEESNKIVNKAITKASSLIKYLMEHHSKNPPLKKITKDSINVLRLDYKCQQLNNVQDDYKLQNKLINQFKKKIFVTNVSKTILNLVNYKNPDKQSIYNTDTSRNNYVIKTSTKWNEDKAGIKFTEYVIKPFLFYIRELITEFRENYIEKENIKNYDNIKQEKYMELYSSTLSLESALMSDILIKNILKELSPYLRYLEKEIEELEKFDELEQLQQNIKEIIENSSSDEDDTFL